MLTWLYSDTPLPTPENARPDGLLAAGSDLGVARLEQAYAQGTFPWFNRGDPVLWWNPDPRMVLACDQLVISRSLAKKLRQIARLEGTEGARIRITTDTAFEAVIHACGAVRTPGSPLATADRPAPGTWISPAIEQAYTDWHEAGRAHSVETWMDGRLAGGLYGVSLGRFFFGESMFSLAPDASKLALAYLVAFLKRHGVMHIDCQQETRHLASLGAKPIRRHAFLALLDETLHRAAPPWAPGELLQSGRLLARAAETTP
ncbi:MAG: leucyl/phenylalanyl-tRNA--protein transferase [Candidimonas sp.]